MAEMTTLHTRIYECATSLNPNRSAQRVKDSVIVLNFIEYDDICHRNDIRRRLSVFNVRSG